MSISNEDIILAGTRMFNEKGYANTSVQDIVDSCGVSKGSFYKFYASKEEVFIVIFSFLQDEFRSSVSMLEELDLEPSVRFKLTCNMFMQLFSENHLILRDPSTPEPPIIKARKQDFLVWLLQTLNGMIKDMYGPELERYSWDLTTVWRGTSRELANLLAKGRLPECSVLEASVYLCDLLDKIALALKDGESAPFISDDVIREQLGISGDETPGVDDYLKQASEIYQNSLVDPERAQRAEEIKQMTRFFKEEMQSEQPRQYLLYAILDSLEKEKELETIVRQLRLAVKAMPQG